MDINRVILALLFLPLAAFGQTRGLTATPSGANGTLLWPTGTLTLTGGIELTTPVDYDDGGTNAVTQSAARANLGGVKVAANLASLGVADMNGQLGATVDGSFGIDRNGDGTWTDEMALAPSTVYFKSLNKGGDAGTIVCGAINVTASGAGAHNYITASGGTFIDNSLDLFNTTGGFSAWATWFPGDAIGGRALAGGIGPSSGGNLYQSTAYFATNAPIASPTDIPIDMLFSQETQDGAPSNQHARIRISYTGITLYGITAGANTGPVGVWVDDDGRVGVGTNSPTSGSELTINGEVAAGNGAVGTPAHSFSNDTDCGEYRIGSNNIGYSIGGTKLMDWSAGMNHTVGQVKTSGADAGFIAAARNGGTGMLLYSPSNASLYIYDNANTNNAFIFTSADSFTPGAYGTFTDLGSSSSKWKRLYLDQTHTAAGTTGDQTISKSGGSVNFAAAAQTITVTNTLVSTSTNIQATVATDDTTAFACKAIAGSGSFVLKLNAAATAETRVNWVILP